MQILKRGKRFKMVWSCLFAPPFERFLLTDITEVKMTLLLKLNQGTEARCHYNSLQKLCAGNYTLYIRYNHKLIKVANIYITSSRLRETFRNAFVQALSEYGHSATYNNFKLGTSLNDEINKIIATTDIYIAIISNDLKNDTLFYNEFLSIKTYAGTKKDKLFIPIFLPNVNFETLPPSIQDVMGIKLEDESSSSIKNAAQQIDTTITSFYRNRAEEVKKEVEIKEKIEKRAHEYISETLKEIKTREDYLRLKAVGYYNLGLICLFCGLGIVIFLFVFYLYRFANASESWSFTVFFSLKSLFIISLVIAISKYSFTLAKSYMSESLKIADRQHAISFGKFYLQVNEKVEPSDLKEIFRDWNISSQTSFVSQSTNDYDPKCYESYP